MSPANEPLAPARPRSPRLVRAVLLGACGAGLLGLSLPHSPSPATPSVSVTAAASSSYADAAEFEPRTVHVGPGVVTRRVPPRATRSRRVVVAKRVQHHVSGWVRPSYAGIVSPYGPRNGGFHKGIDFGAGYGAPIFAVGDGVVIDSGYLNEESGYGQITLIRHPNGVVSAYAHQSRMFVHAGDRVTAGQIIGLVGSTGHSTGPHLHFEIRMSVHGGQVNPAPWLREHGVNV